MAQAKKNLIITLEFPPTPGGVASAVDSFAEAFPQGTAIVLAPPDPAAEAWDSLRSFPVVRTPLLFPRFFWPRWLRILPKALLITGTQPIGRVMAHHALPVGSAALLLRWFWKIPFLLFYHGTDIQAALGSWRKRQLLQFVAKHAEVNVFESEFLRRKFVEAYPHLNDRALVLSSCPNPIFFVPAPVQTVDALRDRYALRGKRVLLSVGRMVDGKGFPHVLRIFPKLLDKMPDLVWVVAGDGPKRDLLARQVEEKKLQHAVRFVGFIPPNELPAFYGLADLFILLTHPDEGKEEGLGLVFLEAAAAGVPVVAGRSGGVEEAVIHEETGFVVDARRDEEVLRACLTLLQDEAARERIQRQAYERVVNHFQWRDRIDRLAPWLA